MDSLTIGEKKPEINDLMAALNRIIDSFKSDEMLSEFEKGQVDGLRWCKQIIEEWE